eukprot:4526451-Pleurochrysis_carterae.AAC.2
MHLDSIRCKKLETCGCVIARVLVRAPCAFTELLNARFGIPCCWNVCARASALDARASKVDAFLALEIVPLPIDTR